MIPSGVSSKCVCRGSRTGRSKVFHERPFGDTETQMLPVRVRYSTYTLSVFSVSPGGRDGARIVRGGERRTARGRADRCFVFRMALTMCERAAKKRRKVPYYTTSIFHSGYTVNVHNIASIRQRQKTRGSVILMFMEPQRDPRGEFRALGQRFRLQSGRIAHRGGYPRNATEKRIVGTPAEALLIMQPLQPGSSDAWRV
jgi:hypothetical protein